MASSRQIEQAAAAWLARRESGAWTDADQAGLDAWLAESTAHRVAFLRLESAWHESGRLAALGAGQSPGAAPPRGQWAASPLDRTVPPRVSPVAWDALGLSEETYLQLFRETELRYDEITSALLS